MPRKRRASNERVDISARLPGDSSTDAPPPKPTIIGGVNIAGGNITTYHTTGLSAAEINQLFDELYAAIEAHPNAPITDREDLKAEIKEFQSAVTEATMKNEKVDEGFVSRRFRNIARMAPDVLDMVIATLGTPLAGLGVTAKKIAEHAKAETRMAGDSTTDAPPPDVKKKKPKGK